MPTTTVTSHGDPIPYGGHHPGKLIVEHHAPSGEPPFVEPPFVVVRAIDRCGEVEIRLWDAEIDELVAQLVAARNAPRLAARLAPEIVAIDVDGAMALVRTPYEWAAVPVADCDLDDDLLPGEVTIPHRGNSGDPLALRTSDATWHSDDRAEVKARQEYALERNLSYCEGCSREVAEELSELGEDGPEACDACHAESADEFAAAVVVCIGDMPATTACGWAGKGADASYGSCPQCGGEVEEIAADVRATSDAIALVPGPAIPLHVVAAWTAEERAAVRAHVDGLLHAIQRQYGVPWPPVPACLSTARARVGRRTLRCAGGPIGASPCGWVGTLGPTETACPGCGGEVEAVQIAEEFIP